MIQRLFRISEVEGQKTSQAEAKRHEKVKLEIKCFHLLEAISKLL